MAVRRKKLDRKVDVACVGGTVVDLPPGWKFTVTSAHHGDAPLDFGPFRADGREELAGHVRDAFWSLRFELEATTLQSYRKMMRRFWSYLDDLAAQGTAVTRLDQIDRDTVDGFLTWMRLMPLQCGEGVLAISAQRQTYTAIKAFLGNRLRRTPTSCNPNLSLPRNRFPNADRLIPTREPYSADEHKEIIRGLNKDLRSIHEGEGSPLAYVDVLAVHLVIFGIGTGRNAQPLLELKRSSIQSHPLPDRELLVTFKRRSRRTHASSYKRAQKENKLVNTIPAVIADHLRWLAAYTAPLAAEADSDLCDYLFLWKGQVREGAGKIRVVRLLDLTRTQFAEFVARHDIRDDRGKPLVLNMSRLRPTYATELYRRTRTFGWCSRSLATPWLKLRRSTTHSCRWRQIAITRSWLTRW